MVEIKEVEEMMNAATNPEQFPRPSWAGEEKSIDEIIQETPLFMTDYKEGYTNDALEALKALKYDGTPEENAENFRNQGNEMLAYRPPRRQDAINYYTEAIEQKSSDKKLNSICYCNRAAVNLDLKNYRKVINDCVKALELDPENIKAFYRASRALYALDKASESIECCEAGLKLSPDNAALKTQLEKSKQLLDKIIQKEEETEKRLKAEEERKEVLQRAIKERNIQFRDKDDRMYEPDLESNSSVKYDMEYDQLLWPVFFLYPEFKESDFIESCGDRTTFLDHIEVMFEQSAPWDPEHNYNPSSIEVYFESFPTNATKPTLVKIGKKLEIGKILSHPKYFVVNGIPSFIILSSKSKFKDEFLNRYRQNV